MEKDTRMTVLLVSYDGYSDLWRDFFNCKKNNWSDCPFETVMANNEMEWPFDDVRVVHGGKDAEWSKRARLALENIDTKYVCLMLEDFFICEGVNNQDIYQALDLMEKDGLKYYKLDTFTKIDTKTYGEYKHLKCIPANLKYGISLLTAIWDREFFLSKLGKEDYNAWIFEMERNEEAQAAGADCTPVGVFDTRNPLKICHMVVQGQFLPNALRQMKRKGYIVDTTKRKTMSTKTYIVYMASRKMALLSRKYPFVRKMARLFGVRTATDKQAKK